MFFWLILRAAARLRGWRLYALMLLGVFVVSWALMLIFEPSTATITNPKNYWWWFFVTAFTVGYGDYSPVSIGGRIGGLLVMMTAIGVVAALVGDVLNAASARRTKRMKGVAPVREHDHFVILGYSTGRTEALAAHLCDDKGAQVVLCALPEQAHEHPIPHRSEVSFVRGNFRDPQVLAQANIGQARAVIVDEHEEGDDGAIVTALVVHQFYPHVHVVIAAQDADATQRLLHSFSPELECVERHDLPMLSEAAAVPGVTRFYADIRTIGRGADTYSVGLLDGAQGHQLGELMVQLKSQHNVTVCAMSNAGQFTTNPPADTQLVPGMTLYYIADHRLGWDEVRPLLASTGSGSHT